MRKWSKQSHDSLQGIQTMKKFSVQIQNESINLIVRKLE